MQRVKINIVVASVLVTGNHRTGECKGYRGLEAQCYFLPLSLEVRLWRCCCDMYGGGTLTWVPIAVVDTA